MDTQVGDRCSRRHAARLCASSSLNGPLCLVLKGETQDNVVAQETTETVRENEWFFVFKELELLEMKIIINFIIQIKM